MTEVIPLARLMQGNEAVAEGALAAGARFFAGYPITPSTEIAEILAKKLPAVGGKFIQMEDEISSMAAVIGASLVGLKSLTATSGPGFSLKQENLGFAALAEIPCVVVNVQRYGPSTGIPTATAQGDIMQARWGTHGDHPMIVLCPASVQESFTLTIQAFNLSERFRTPVVLLSEEIIGHSRERVVLPDLSEIKIINRKKPPAGLDRYCPYQADADGVPPMANFGEGYRYHVTGLIHDESGGPTTDPKKAESLINRLNNKIMDHLDEITMTESLMTEDAEIIIFAYGATARSAKSAVKKAREMGIKAGLFRPLTIWPFPAKEVAALCARANAIIVPELNLGQLIGEVERVAGLDTRVTGINRVSGEMIRPDEILDAIKTEVKVKKHAK
ncbi:MAG: 2-oxoglutarate oxidoreductase subunit KorA [Firmicutes bacterium ADurb.Bin373]|nr:2-oxoacid:acceptor oxidoreductase subunit alpha [Bacillota bacterium]OQA08242.1 MAG: 2-oxoglutarate oxidoreductase subunit KorA [Firmicutes bacterium ADurb.Bin373]